MTQDSRRPLRADAERNRRRVLETADRMLAERGTTVTLTEVARQAGVGIGTAYRRFPDLQALIDALYGERFTAFLQLTADAAQQEDPDLVTGAHTCKCRPPQESTYGRRSRVPPPYRRGDAASARDRKRRRAHHSRVSAPFPAASALPAGAPEPTA
ncbi:helix-turn-helix domain-containing protein [Streptomyces halstedii]|uniref:TetR/AcrR family transcriptional regulator n=1 Tax=Streptomyces halstedii TaxID=1944 RepID=UPI003460A1C5